MVVVVKQNNYRYLYLFFIIFNILIVGLLKNVFIFETPVFCFFRFFKMERRVTATPVSITFTNDGIPFSIK